MKKTSTAIIKWKSRNLTLLVPKINHFILTISNPKIETIKNFGNYFYNFSGKKKEKKKKKYYNSRVCMRRFKDGLSFKMLHSNANWKKSFSSELNIDIVNLLIFGIDCKNN